MVDWINFYIPLNYYHAPLLLRQESKIKGENLFVIENFVRKMKATTTFSVVFLVNQKDSLIFLVI
jgi:hypothetical protein